MFKRGQYLESIGANRADIRSELKRFAQNGESFLRLISPAEQKCIFFFLLFFLRLLIYTFAKLIFRFIAENRQCILNREIWRKKKHHSSMLNMQSHARKKISYHGKNNVRFLPGLF